MPPGSSSSSLMSKSKKRARRRARKKQAEQSQSMASTTVITEQSMVSTVVTTERDRCLVTVTPGPINKIPDDALLAIFDFYVENVVNNYQCFKEDIEAWQLLVHVCRRWRGIVFGSPRRLNLRLVCTTTTRVRDRLDVWPALPLLFRYDISERTLDDIIVALKKHSDRVYSINIDYCGNSQLEEISAAIQKPFSNLIQLELSTRYSTEGGALSESILGGSAPRLRSLALNRIPFPGLPKLLLSAPNLAHLSLQNLPDSGYISPETMANCLSALTGLRSLCLGPPSPRSRLPPPPTRSILPAITHFDFNGASEYLEDFVVCFDAPRINCLDITFDDETEIDTSRLVQFINRSPSLMPDEAHLYFFESEVWASFSSQTSRHLIIKAIDCEEEDAQLSFTARFCALSLRFLSTVENLYVYEEIYQDRRWQDDLVPTQWLELLSPFNAVKNIFLTESCAGRVVRILREFIGGEMTEVLPSLQKLFLEGLESLESIKPVQEDIRQFVAARQLIGQNITVSSWDEDVWDTEELSDYRLYHR